MNRSRLLFKDLGLRFKTLVFIVLVTVIPIVGIMWMLLQTLSQASTSAENNALDQFGVLVRQELLGSVTATAKIYDLTLKNLLISLDGVRAVAEQDESRLERAIADYYYSNPLLARVYAVQDGKVAVSSPSMVPDAAVVARINLWEALMTGSKAPVGQWIGPYLDPVSGETIMTYALPQRGDDGLVRIIAFDITAVNLLTKVTTINPSVSSYTVIVGTDGRFISSSETIRKDFGLAEGEGDSILLSFVPELSHAESLLSSRDERNGFIELPTIDGRKQKVVLYATIPSLAAKLFLVSPFDELLALQSEKVAVIQAATSRVATMGFIAIILLATFIAIASYAFSDRVMIRPLQRLMQGIIRLEGSEASSVEERGDYAEDEIGSLAKRFDDMAEGLRDSRANLEKKVEERTAELNKSLVEVERINKLMIGRELRMQELKKEIDRLKKG